MSQDTSIPGGQPFPSLRELTGTVIDGRYEIGRVLGTGGMGAVYEAIQLRLDRRVAIKILNPVYMHREDYVTRFMREAKAASKIRHANVVQMMDFGELPGGSVYSVMEFLEGRDLAQLLQAEGRLPWPRVRLLMLQMARGLRAAHEQGVIHRDIKPANLFLVMRRGDDEQDHEVLKILDFGIARMQSQPSQNTSALTGTAELLGTPSYMAPELARGRSANPRSEVYSVGVVAYRMLTGRLPFEGETAFDVLFRSATEAAPPMKSLDPSIPDAVNDLVMRMIDREPERRFDQMAELYKAIHAIDEHGRLNPERLNPTGPHMPVGMAAQATVPSRASGPVPMGPFAPPARNTAPMPEQPVAPHPAQSLPFPAAAQPTPTNYTPSGPINPSGPQVVVPPPLTSEAMQAAADAARAGNTAPVGPHGEPTAPAPSQNLDPRTPGSGLHPLPLGGADVTNPGLFEPTPGAMQLPTQPGAQGMAATGQGPSYDSLAGMEVAGRNNKIWIFGVLAFLLVIVVAAVVAPGDEETGTTKADADAGDGDKLPVILESPPVQDEDDAGVEQPPPADDGAAPEAKIEVEPAPEPAPAVDPVPTQPEPLVDDDIVIDEPVEEPPAPATKPRRPSTKPRASKPKTAAKTAESGTAKADKKIDAQLKQRAKQKCGSLLAGKPLKVSYMIGSNGKTMAIKISRGGVLEKCVEKVVESAKYPTSDKARRGGFKL